MENHNQTSYQFASAALALVAEGADGFDDDAALADWEARLSAHLDAQADKISACVAIVRRADNEAAYQKQEAERHMRAAKRAADVAASVTDRIGAMLRAQEAATGVSLANISGGWVKILRKVSTQTIVDVDADQLDFEFQRLSTEPDKPKIKAALESGQIVTGCSLAKVVNESVKFSK